MRYSPFGINPTIAGSLMSTQAALTPTSYAILGLLAIKPWTTYELAKQMDRTLNRFWPRARSKLYDCLLYTSPSPRDISGSRMPSSA